MMGAFLSSAPEDTRRQQSRHPCHNVAIFPAKHAALFLVAKIPAAAERKEMLRWEGSRVRLILLGVHVILSSP